jgi:hypothetical protein
MNNSRITGVAGPLGLLLLLAGPCPAQERWGTIKGQVSWAGAKVPKPREDLVVNPRSKGVKDVFVFLIDATDPTKVKRLPVNPALERTGEAAVVIQAGPPRRFEPHALALQQGQTLAIENTTRVADAIAVEAGDDPGAGRFVLPAGEALRRALGASRHVIPVSSAINRSMRLWVWVFDHPYFAVTDTDGKFEIKGAPAGRWRLVIWHSESGWVNGLRGKGQPVEIQPGKAVEVNATIRPQDVER